MDGLPFYVTMSPRSHFPNVLIRRFELDPDGAIYAMAVTCLCGLKEPPD